MHTDSLSPFVWIIIILAVWDIYWKGKALWKAAKQSQSYWFVALLLSNTIGVLPLLYLFLFSKNRLNNK